MKKKKAVAGILIISMCSMLLSGCGTKKNALMNYRIDAPTTDTQKDISSVESENYLSQGVCVIPKVSQTGKKDSIMAAKAALMINDTKGKMLYSQNIYKKVYPASITKIVTALVALEYGDLEDTVTISYNASHIMEYGAKLCGFAQGDKITLKDLLYSFLICSGNDAGVAIAEHIAGSVDAFAKMMNQEMQKIGAVHSHFVNPHGLHDKKHYTTAYDLYLVFHKLVKNKTFLDIVSHSTYVAKFRSSKNKKKKLFFLSTDRYLIGRATAPSGVEVIGGKTGTTFDAGSCLILYSKNKKGDYFVSVVLKAQGGNNLYAQMNNLLSYENK